MLCKVEGNVQIHITALRGIIRGEGQKVTTL